MVVVVGIVIATWPNPITAAVGRVWHTLAMHAEVPENEAETADSKVDDSATVDNATKKEVGGRGGLDPTRYGDWEMAGRCIDF